jgi:hypothetical protein
MSIIISLAKEDKPNFFTNFIAGKKTRPTDHQATNVNHCKRHSAYFIMSSKYRFLLLYISGILDP